MLVIIPTVLGFTEIVTKQASFSYYAYVYNNCALVFSLFVFVISLALLITLLKIKITNLIIIILIMSNEQP